MFDPTIYENIKVVLEGAVYDLDLEDKIIITNRLDLIDLASMSRAYQIEFRMADIKEYPAAKILLEATIQDLATEIINEKEKEAGCTLEVNFYTNRDDYSKLENDLKRIWEERPNITQEISYTYGSSKKENKINLNFERKINEDQIVDIGDFIEYIVKTLLYLKKEISA